jgi:predicted dehydrogenase
MIRVGFVGAGNAASAHIAALAHVEEAAIVAFCDPVVERAQERAGQVGARAVADLDALWDLVDAVWVCSPPHLHAEHAVAAGRAGRHVFVERPMANSVEAATQIVEACRAGGARLMVGHVLRWVPALQRLRQLAAAGDLGDVVACWSRRSADATPAELPWYRRDWRRGGGFTVEWGLQELDFLRWIGSAVGGGGEVRTVHGRVAFGRKDYPEFDDYARATLTFERGLIGGFDGGLGAHIGGITRAVVGTRAIATNEGRSLRVRFARDGVERTIDVPAGTDPERHVNAAVLAEDREFLAAIAEGRDPAVAGEEGRTAVALCLAVHRSSREGREVRLDEM